MGIQALALVDIGGAVIDENLLFFFTGLAGFVFLGTYIFMHGRTKEIEPITEAWEYEASGLLWPVPVTKEEPTSIEYKIRYGKGMEPVTREVKHTHPFTPIGTAQRVFLVPRGSTMALDPRASFAEGQDQDDPEPLIQESAAWYRRAREMMMSAGLKLKENWFTILMIGLAMFGLGVIAESRFLLVPST